MQINKKIGSLLLIGTLLLPLSSFAQANANEKKIIDDIKTKGFCIASDWVSKYKSIPNPQAFRDVKTKKVLLGDSDITHKAALKFLDLLTESTKGKKMDINRLKKDYADLANRIKKGQTCVKEPKFKSISEEVVKKCNI